MIQVAIIVDIETDDESEAKSLGEDMASDLSYTLEDHYSECNSYPTIKLVSKINKPCRHDRLVKR